MIIQLKKLKNQFLYKNHTFMVHDCFGIIDLTGNTVNAKLSNLSDKPTGRMPNVSFSHIIFSSIYPKKSTANTDQITNYVIILCIPSKPQNS